MIYIVTATTVDTITLWDGETKEDKHPSRKGGLMFLHVGTHAFQKGDKVQVHIKLHERPAATQ